MPSDVMITIFGPSAAGKSTAADLLKEDIDRIYTVDFDVIKRQLSGYDWKRDSEVAQAITLDTLAAVAKAGLPILVLLPPLRLKETYDRVAAIANTNGYTLLNIEMTAPQEVLIKRYQDRLDQIKASGTKGKFKTIEEFKAKLQVPYYRPTNTVTFNSAEKNPETIFNDIKELLSKSSL